MVVLGIVAQAIRWLGGAQLWLDEQMIARNIRDRDFGGLAAALDYNQSAPIGWLWAQRLVVVLFGTDERTLRLLPFLFAAGSLVLAWLICRRYLGVAGTCGVVALFAVNPAVLRYSTEVKQYSADVFFVLLLIGVALWAVRTPLIARRFLIWWATAALACLFSMGAILATPGLAILLVGAAWWRGRWWSAVRAGLPAVIWLLTFVVHYWLSLRHVLANDYMTQFWAGRGFPPEDAGGRGTVAWVVRRLEVLGVDPLGLDAAGLGRDWLIFACVVFWTMTALGVAVAMSRRPPMGLLLAVPTASAFVLAILWISPLYMRLAMWMMPALFLSVGFAVDAAARAAIRPLRRGASTEPTSRGRPGWLRWTAAGAGALAVLIVMVPYGPVVATRFRPAAPIPFDYRASTAWLQAQHRSGDLTIGIHGSHDAIGWYDPDNLLNPAQWVVVPGPDEGCDQDNLRQRLAGFDRVLVYGELRGKEAMLTGEALSTILADHAESVQEGEFGPRGMVQIVVLRPDPAPATDGGPCLVFR